MKTTITRNGQVVIPAKIRQRHHIIPGQQFEVIDRGAEITLIPIKTIPVSQARGWLISSESAAELLAEAREIERQKEEDFKNG